MNKRQRKKNRKKVYSKTIKLVNGSVYKVKLPIAAINWSRKDDGSY